MTNDEVVSSNFSYYYDREFCPSVACMKFYFTVETKIKCIPINYTNTKLLINGHEIYFDIETKQQY